LQDVQVATGQACALAWLVEGLAVCPCRKPAFNLFESDGHGEDLPDVGF